MSLLSGLMGHASEISPAQAAADYARLLAPSERVQLAYKLIRDVIILTDKRVILIDKQGVTGRKTEYLSIPYRSITRFSVESAGSFDMEAELRIWSSGAEPVQLTFGRGVDVYALQAALAVNVTG
ncbi:PH domain-containing protein [Pararoseomonas sp. SCSIO 73927]|uniref:PH domain-containing protein n=1 Tax=Pararoseomonas sp. SCSIO 73927 TaxID=3114537 RepID=UPI0030CEB7F7